MWLSVLVFGRLVLDCSFGYTFRPFAGASCGIVHMREEEDACRVTLVFPVPSDGSAC